MITNNHWSEPLHVEVENATTWGEFYIPEIADAADENHIPFGIVDDDDLTIEQRTAIRLEYCYNACAGLHIQRDTKLKNLLLKVMNALHYTPGTYLESAPLILEIEALLED